MKRVNGIWLPGYEEEMVRFIEHRASMLEGRGSYQRAKWERAIALCRPHRRVALDIGAHVGMWSIPLSRAFDRVYAFEPHALHRQCFERNLQDRDNVVLIPSAVGETPGMATLSTEDRSSGDTHIVLTGCGQLAPICRIDDVIGSEIPVDLVKLDCEGYELPALRGAEQTLRRWQPTVVVEQKPQHADRYGFEPQAACKFLEALGAQLVAEIVGDFYYRW